MLDDFKSSPELSHQFSKEELNTIKKGVHQNDNRKVSLVEEEVEPVEEHHKDGKKNKKNHKNGKKQQHKGNKNGGHKGKKNHQGKKPHKNGGHHGKKDGERRQGPGGKHGPGGSPHKGQKRHGGEREMPWNEEQMHHGRKHRQNKHKRLESPFQQEDSMF